MWIEHVLVIRRKKKTRQDQPAKPFDICFLLALAQMLDIPVMLDGKHDYMSTFYIKLNTEAKLQYYSSSKQIVSIVVSPSPALPTVLYSAGHVTIYLSALWLPFKRNNSQLDTSSVVELELPGAGFFGAAPVPEPIFWSKAAPAASFWKAKRKMKEPVPEPT